MARMLDEQQNTKIFVADLRAKQEIRVLILQVIRGVSIRIEFQFVPGNRVGDVFCQDCFDLRRGHAWSAEYAVHVGVVYRRARFFRRSLCRLSGYGFFGGVYVCHDKASFGAKMLACQEKHRAYGNEPLNVIGSQYPHARQGGLSSHMPGCA